MTLKANGERLEAKMEAIQKQLEEALAQIRALPPGATLSGSTGPWK
jgi:hypothetical protein